LLLLLLLLAVAAAAAAAAGAAAAGAAIYGPHPNSPINSLPIHDPSVMILIASHPSAGITTIISID